MDINYIQDIIKEKENLKKVNLKIKNNSLNTLFTIISMIVVCTEIFILYPFLSYILTNNIGIVFLVFLSTALIQFYIIFNLDKSNFSLYVIEKFLSSFSKKQGVSHDHKLFELFKSNFYSTENANEIKNYFITLNSIQQDYFLSEIDRFDIFLFNKIADYIELTDVDTLKQNKKIISDILLKELQEEEIKFLTNKIKNKIKKDTNINRNEILNAFNDEKEEKVKKTIIREL